MFRRKIAIAVILAILSIAAYFVYGIFSAWRRIPEAYAAWDTGTLLVQYMRVHDRQWPSSWEDLLSATRNDAGDSIVFRGANANDTNYAVTLRKMVAINWKFNPSRPDESRPVTRLDGTRFPMVWHGAEPNEMVRAYLSSAVTNAP